jgi:ABC-type amino acid transport substrate-binding protein
LRAETPLAPDIKRIVDRGTLVVAVLNKDFAPLFSADEDGNLSGFDIQLANGIAEHLGVKAYFNRKADTFDEVVHLVARQDADLAISWISRTPERAKSVRFTRPYSEQAHTILINRIRGVKFRRNCPTTQELVKPPKLPGAVGVVKGTAFARTATTLAEGYSLKSFPSMLQMVDALYRGDLLMAYHGELEARKLLMDQEEYSIKVKLCELDRPTDKIAIAVRYDAPNLVEYLNVYLEAREVFSTAQQLLANQQAQRLGGVLRKP